MSANITALLVAFGAVVIAEMGDKTQLLAMAFAAKYKFLKVMIGVLIATILNHALAVIVGNFLATNTQFAAAKVWIQGIAALSFIFFGLWTIRGDKLEGEADKKTKYGAVATVAIAFFLAEMGDKTQLATVALAAQFPAGAIWVLTGTTLGMLVADAFGIIISVLLCKRIPERTVKIISAGIFILFGFNSVWQVMGNQLSFSFPLMMTIILTLAVITSVISVYLIRKMWKAGDVIPPPEFCKIKDEDKAESD